MSQIPTFRTAANVPAAPAEPKMVSTALSTPTPSGGRARKENRYPANCISCGGNVAAGAGLLAKDDSGRWAAEHKPGQCTTDAPTGADLVWAPSVIDGFLLADGVYTLETPRGHRTFRLRTQAPDDSFMPGKQVIGFLHGPANEFSFGDWTSFGHITNGRVTVWKKHRDNDGLIADVHLFMLDPSQAQASRVCFRCHRTLTTPESIATGMGPECAGRGL